MYVLILFIENVYTRSIFSAFCKTCDLFCRTKNTYTHTHIHFLPFMAACSLLLSFYVRNLRRLYFNYNCDFIMILISMLQQSRRNSKSNNIIIHSDSLPHQHQHWHHRHCRYPCRHYQQLKR